MDKLEIRSLAFRYNKGPSGGPGGSNSLIDLYNKEYKVINNLKCFYRESFISRRPFSFVFEKLRTFLRKYLNCMYLDRLEEEKYIKKAILSAPSNTLFLAHDVWTGSQLYKYGMKYLLVYHQQGSTDEEARSFGRSLSKSKIQELVQIEREAFLNAIKVIFTSKGAFKSYLETSKLSKEDLVKIKEKVDIVYNTCMVYKETKEPSEYKKIAKFLRQNGKKEILLTVSSLSHFKGVDQIPKFLSKIKNFKNDFIWVLCGEGHLRSKIFDEIDKYSLKNNFFYIKRRMPQKELAYLYEKSSYYLMMHRLSIFDLATLEAMSHRCVPILSAVGGNLEFNKEKNVLFIKDVESKGFLDVYKSKDNRLGILNEKVFYKYFGPLVLLRGFSKIIGRLKNEVK